MKAGTYNLHTHCTFCDGKNTVEEMVEAAIQKGFELIGFSSHVAFPNGGDCFVDVSRYDEYVKAVRAAAFKYQDEIKVRCGIEAEYIKGVTDPDRERYAMIRPDYVIGSIHTVVSKNGGQVCVDGTPEELMAGIREHFNGRAEDLVREYFKQEREMILEFDFDIVGHPDLVRKFNAKHPFFNEEESWYREELRQTADVLKLSGKLTEVNTGAISRGWMADAYPAEEFRKLLRERNVKMILSSDAHAAESINCAFDYFAGMEDYEEDFRKIGLIL